MLAETSQFVLLVLGGTILSRGRHYDCNVIGRRQTEGGMGTMHYNTDTNTYHAIFSGLVGGQRKRAARANNLCTSDSIQCALLVSTFILASLPASVPRSLLLASLLPYRVTVRRGVTILTYQT